jgi:hypothetical protein
MNFRKTRIAAIFAVAAAQANAQSPTPAWQEPGYVMGEIVVCLPHAEQIPADALEEIVVTLSRAEQDAMRIVDEIVVTLSLEEQAVIRTASLESQHALEPATKAQHPMRL